MKSGEVDVAVLEQSVCKAITDAGGKVDYAQVTYLLHPLINLIFAQIGGFTHFSLTSLASLPLACLDAISGLTGTRNIYVCQE